MTGCAASRSTVRAALSALCVCSFHLRPASLTFFHPAAPTHHRIPVYGHDHFIVATNDAHDRLWRSNVELFQEAMRRRTIPHLLLAS